MSAEYVRLCPTCGQENAPEVMRCTCGALLSGVDLSARVALAAAAAADSQPEKPPESPSTAATPAAEARLCPHADCGQPNPPDAERCLYCNRPLSSSDDGLSGETPGTISLIALPGKLRERFRIVRALPTAGAEAELLIVEALAGGPEQVAKIYRHGIHPDREVLARIARIDAKHRVEVLESGLADGFTYELMEYCRAGSLRELLGKGRPSPARLREIVDELAAAIAGVHQAGLIHRDLKPENVLVRSSEPLDLVLTDFSIASLQNATLHFTGVARTLAYGAPETLSGVINQQADWWSLGMILLEAAIGQHPFSGLSDAVILHRLTTRNIDLSAVDEPKLKKLLRGLLLRDPKNRWGHAQIVRWLADDPSLADAPGDESEPQARQPYRIGDEQCFTAEQLAVGLANHWQKALSDLDNGLLLTWLRTELKDQNRVRFLIELNLERELHVDLRLLRLIIDLAPGIPPVWRGDSLGLRNILRRADRALKNDAEAAQWLQTLHESRVLNIYAAAGNTEAADIAKRWQSALEQFNSAWDSAITRIKDASRAAPGDVVDYDEVVYGRGGPSRPAPRQLHARLLAMAYDPAWTTRLRDYLSRETARLSLDSPWLQALGEIDQLPPAGLLALESLLPEARKQAHRMQEREQRADAEAQAQTRQLLADSAIALAEIRETASQLFFDDSVCRELTEKNERFARLAAQMRAMGGSDEAYLNLRRRITRVEPSINRLQRLIDTLLERRAVNRGWLNQQTLGFFALAAFLLPILVSQRLTYPLLIAGLLFIAWRLLPNWFTVRKIRELLLRVDSGA